ncbi:MAG: FAD-dependent oxidoreductase [Pseudobdellovibrionaceae bacterium]
MSIVRNRISKETFDVAVIGGGLSGLLISAALHREGLKIALLDSSDFLGGASKAVQSKYGVLNNGLRFIPDTNLAHQGLEFLASVLGREVRITSEETPPVTYESGEVRPFVGFGDRTPAYFEEISYFLSAQRLLTDSQPHEWVRILTDLSPSTRFTRSWVTRFVVENGHVNHAIINGDKTLHAHHFVFTGRLKDLSVLLADEFIPVRSKQKLAKGPHWTAVCLDLFHSALVTESKAIHVLNGTTDDELGPCVGQFLSTTENQEIAPQVSQWLTLLDEEATEDSEIVAGALKKIKKQIKRAYPKALEGIKQERIVVNPAFSISSEIKLNANQTWPGLPNLWIGTGQAHNQRNLLGTLLQSSLVSNAMKQTLLSPTKSPSKGPQMFNLSNEIAEEEPSPEA